ncbi:MAG TPA: MlaD family protein [Longimicrobiales bacterium]|nr:MlaD family protein [Longimicrobiales bacterium]
MNSSIRGARSPRPAFNLAAVLGARQRRRTLIGMLLIAVSVVLAVLIFLLDPLRQMLRDDVELVALLDAAPALSPGAAVWIAGREVGSVETLEFLPLGGNGAPRLALVLRVPRDRLSIIRRDATVRIASASMAGDAVVDILPGSAGAPPIQPGDTLRAEPVLTAAELRTRIAAVRAASDSLRVETRPVAAAARARMLGLTRVQSGFARVQGGLDELSRTIAESPAATLAASDDVDRALQRLRAAGAVITDAGGAESGVRRTIAAFQPLAGHSAELGARIDSLMARGSPNGTLARLQADSALAVALRRTRLQLDSLIADARANPFRYVF